MFSSLDVSLTFVLIVVLGQLSWLLSVLHRKGLSSAVSIQALPPFVAVWVVFWPAYDHGQALILSFMVFLLWLLLLWKLPICADLRRSLRHPSRHYDETIFFFVALWFSAWVFTHAPEYAFGMALSLCLALPLSLFLDRFSFFVLGKRYGMPQGLLGHLALIITVALLCAWSINLYHGIAWHHLLIASLIAGCSASLMRLLFSPSLTPLAMVVAMLTSLWLL